MGLTANAIQSPPEEAIAVPAADVRERTEPLQAILDALRARQDELVDVGVHRIRTEIAGYAEISDPAFFADVRTHVSQEHDALIRSIELGRPLRSMEIDFVRPRAMRRVGRLPLGDFMHAFRIYTEVFWDAVLESADDEATRREALALPSIVMRYMSIAAGEAAEVYVEAERLLLAQGERGRRDLLEDLLGGRAPEPGPKLAAARQAGLAPACPCVLVVASATAALPDDHHLRACATWLSRAFGGVDQPLAVVRHREVVIVAPVAREGVDDVVRAITAVQSQLADERLTLAIGVSTVHDDLTSIPDAYREAVSAAERIRPTGGVLALSDLSAFDCLTLFGQATARRRIPAAVRAFVADDVAEGRVLTTTLLEYVAADFNAKLAAERLYVHPNTARYRLAKIEERTGTKLRCVADVLDLLIAIRVAEAEFGAGMTPPVAP
jgi:sugar diacid utilization regulator